MYLIIVRLILLRLYYLSERKFVFRSELEKNIFVVYFAVLWYPKDKKINLIKNFDHWVFWCIKLKLPSNT